MSVIENVVGTVTVPGESIPRVEFLPETVELLRKLWSRVGPLMFHHSVGCCDGRSPMCFAAGDFLTSDRDILLGRLDIAPEGGEPQVIDFWMSVEQFEYWSHTFLSVDVVSGRGSGFSLEAPEGKRFMIRSRLMEGFGPA